MAVLIGVLSFSGEITSIIRQLSFFFFNHWQQFRSSENVEYSRSM